MGSVFSVTWRTADCSCSLNKTGMWCHVLMGNSMGDQFGLGIVHGKLVFPSQMGHYKWCQLPVLSVPSSVDCRKWVLVLWYFRFRNKGYEDLFAHHADPPVFASGSVVDPKTHFQGDAGIKGHWTIFLLSWMNDLQLDLQISFLSLLGKLFCFVQVSVYLLGMQWVQ